MRQVKTKNSALHCSEAQKKRSQGKCKKIRGWLYLTLSRHVSPNSSWLQNHILTCPRCQRRLASYNRVNLALSFMRAQSHSLDLLMRANTQAINVLKHSLREVPEVQKLKKALPEPRLTEKLPRYFQPISNLAACLLVMLLMKIGIFTSIDKFQTQGQKAIRHYYASRIGEDLARDIFPTETL